MVVVVVGRERLRGKDGGMELFIRGEGGLSVFQVLLRDPGVLFGRVSLPSDQEGAGRGRSAVADNLFNFVFFFSFDKVRRWCREVLAVDLIFAIGR